MKRRSGEAVAAQHRNAGPMKHRLEPRGGSQNPDYEEEAEDTMKWDTSNGRKWVVVASWGVETTVTFHRDEQEAEEAYETAVDAGANVFYAKTTRMQMQEDV